MGCKHPLDAKLSPSGKPIFKNNVNYGRFTRLIKLPCGRCIGCKLDRSKQWAIRLTHEAQLHKAVSFLTTTVDNARLTPRQEREPTVPCTPPSKTTPPRKTRITTHTHASTHAHADSLDKTALRLFMKRLRENVRERNPSARIKYFAIGEYGEKLDRPHYHIALFGEDFSDDRYEWRTTEQGDAVYRSSRLEALWPYGNCEIGNLTFKSAAYIARYITKKITGDKADEHYRRIAPDGTNYWLEPEFSLISNGIGKAWFQQFNRDVYPHDHAVIDGKKFKPPRYYDQLLKEFDLQEYEQLKKEREKEALQAAADNTPERLRAKEAVELARLNLNKRRLERP